MSNKRVNYRLPLALLAGISVIAVAGCGGSEGAGATAPTSPPVASPPPATSPAPAPGTPPPVDPMPEEGVLPADSDEATYQVTFTATWTTENGFGSVPAAAHFSSVIGSPVNEQSNLWESGQPSSPGMESVAEIGATGAFSDEIDAEVTANAASGAVILGGTEADNSVSAEITFTREFPLFTFASMVAPSPDWFVGVSKYSLLDTNSEWSDTVELQLPVYDAGTEDGDTFSGSNSATNPLGVIERLNGTVAGPLNFVDGQVDGNSIANILMIRIR